MKVLALATGVAMVLGSAALACAPDEGEEFSCKAVGAGLLSPPLTDAAACTRFSDSLDAALAHGGGTGTRSGIAVTLSIGSKGVARAEVERSPDLGGPFTSSVSVSDKPISAWAIDRLAEEVARNLLKD